MAPPEVIDAEFEEVCPARTHPAYWLGRLTHWLLGPVRWFLRGAREAYCGNSLKTFVLFHLRVAVLLPLALVLLLVLTMAAGSVADALSGPSPPPAAPAEEYAPPADASAMAVPAAATQTATAEAALPTPQAAVRRPSRARPA